MKTAYIAPSAWNDDVSVLIGKADKALLPNGL